MASALEYPERFSDEMAHWARWLAATIPGTVPCVEIDGAKLLFSAEPPETLNRELRDLLGC